MLFMNESSFSDKNSSTLGFDKVFPTWSHISDYAIHFFVRIPQFGGWVLYSDMVFQGACGLADYRFWLSFLAFLGPFCQSRWQTVAILERRTGGELGWYLAPDGQTAFAGDEPSL